MSASTLLAASVLILELLPALAFGFGAESAARTISGWRPAIRMIVPAFLVVPYLIFALPYHIFRWEWFFLYAFLPVVMAWFMSQAAIADPEQRGNWRDALIMLSLGLAVDLRWFDAAWPSGLRGWGNLILVDAGLYAFLGVRHLTGTGFDFHLRKSDWKTGFRELLLFAPVVIGLGLVLGFIHPHSNVPTLSRVLFGWLGVFVFVAVPEELFFRAWVQNLLERRLGRTAALIVASILFGLSHFNKRNLGSAHFNWRYVLLASIAGIFYGRAWREDRRVPASGITHTFVDWLWYLWF